MKRILTIALAALMLFSAAACGGPAGQQQQQQEQQQQEEQKAGFEPKLDRETACVISVVGSYSNFEALEAEFDRFNEFYPDVELRYTKIDDYNNSLDTVLSGSEAPNIFFSFSWMTRPPFW